MYVHKENILGAINVFERDGAVELGHDEEDEHVYDVAHERRHILPYARTGQICITYASLLDDYVRSMYVCI
jgi:hypothetical protein